MTWKLYESQISVSTNKYLWQHSHTHSLKIATAAFSLPQQNKVIATELVWCAKPEIFTVQPSTEKVCQSQKSRDPVQNLVQSKHWAGKPLDKKTQGLARIGFQFEEIRSYLGGKQPPHPQIRHFHLTPLLSSLLVSFQIHFNPFERMYVISSLSVWTPLFAH